MSVQLFLYPQNFKGVFSSIATSNQEFIQDGIDFISLNTSTIYDSASPLISNILLAAPPTVPNTWYRSRSPGPAGGQSAPVELSNNLLLEIASGTNARIGAYQKLTNLIVGASYEVTIETVSSVEPGGLIGAFIYDGNILVAAPIASTTLTVADMTGTFIANKTELTFFLSFFGQPGEEPADILKSISVFGTPVKIPEHDGISGQEICDLYEDEDIPLTLSVDDFKNVAEKVQSYSKAFKLPGTKNNNRIFDALYEITRTAQNTIQFNPYVKTKCVLKQDGLLLFEGYMKMIDIQDKEGEISYNINLYSEVVALVDVLGDRTFSELDFSELEHEYNKTQIKYSWNDLGGGTGITYTNPNTSGFRTSHNTVKYPFVNWTNQYLIGGTGGSLSATADMPELTSLEQAFRPFINVKYCIQRIFDATPFSFKSTFFETQEFEDLFMDFNWGSGNAPVVFNSSAEFGIQTNIPLTSSFVTLNPTPIGTIPSTFGFSSGVFTAQEDNQIYNLQIQLFFIVVGGTTSEFEAQTLINGVVADSFSSLVGNVNEVLWYINPSYTLDAGDTLEIKVKDPDNQTTVVSNVGYPLARIIMTTSTFHTTDATLLETSRGELKQWDFLKGIMTMFNLVSIPDKSDPNNILIEPWVDVFAKTDGASGASLLDREVDLDWTTKIDVSEMKLTPLTDLNKKTIFKFVEDDDDYAATNYKNAAGGWIYGSEIWDASLSANGLPTVLEGEEEVIAEPFAATVIKPLASQFNELIVPSIYSYNPDDGTSEGFDNSPRIMYNNRKKEMGVTTYFIPDENGASSENADTFLQFSHLTNIPTATTGTRDFLFSSRQLPMIIGSPPIDNLFNNYWLPYLGELYNPDTRTMTIKVNLTPADISTFDFSNIVYVKNREFRVNRIDYKPNDLATVEFILLP